MTPEEIKELMQNTYNLYRAERFSHEDSMKFTVAEIKSYLRAEDKTEEEIKELIKNAKKVK